MQFVVLKIIQIEINRLVLTLHFAAGIGTKRRTRFSESSEQIAFVQQCARLNRGAEYVCILVLWVLNLNGVIITVRFMFIMFAWPLPATNLLALTSPSMVQICIIRFCAFNLQHYRVTHRVSFSFYSLISN